MLLVKQNKCLKYERQKARVDCCNAPRRTTPSAGLIDHRIVDNDKGVVFII